MSDESQRMPKVVATRRDGVRHRPEDAANVLRVFVEYSFTSGVYRSAKYEAVITGARNANDFAGAVTDDLVEHLQELFPTENLRSRDVMLFGF
jgi:TATA-box binding protein (TBP) (component of TFIID and TFIIIB)